MKAKLVTVIVMAALALSGITYALISKQAPAKPAEAVCADEQGGAPCPDEAAGVPCPDENAEPKEEENGVNISGLQFAVATAGMGWDTLSLTGKVTIPPDRLVNVSPRIDGKIVSARGTVGDSVSRGQVLAVISSIELADARAQYRKALATLAAAQSSLKREMELARLGAVSVRPVEEARSDTLSAQGEVADAKSALAQARSEQTQAESELVQCKARLQRARELYAEKIVARQDVETAEAEFRRDTAAVDAAKSRVSQAESRIRTAEARTSIAKQYLAREEKVYEGRVMDMRAVQSAKSEVASAQVEVQAAADRIRVLGASPNGSGETIAITSPISGRIVSRTTNIGEMASPSVPIFTIADQSQVWVEADVYEKDLARVGRGKTAQVRVDAYPDKVFTGRIDSIGDILSAESRTAKLRCVVSNSQGLLRGEMFAKVAVIIGRRGNSVWVPKQAVLDDTGKKTVYTPCMDCKADIDAGKSVCGNFDKLEVAIGGSQGDKLEVLSGLEPGTQVVTVGAYQLKTAMGSGKITAGCVDVECED